MLLSDQKDVTYTFSTDNTSTTTSTGTATTNPYSWTLAKKYRCEHCAFEANGWGSGIITVTIPGFEGRHCERCFAAWLAKNIPRMEEVK